MPEEILQEILFSEAFIKDVERAEKRLERKLRPHQEAMDRTRYVSGDERLKRFTPCEIPMQRKYVRIKGFVQRIMDYIK